MNIEEKVIEIMRKNTNIDIEVSNIISVKISDLGLNSLSFIKIIVELEEEFDIEFDDSQLNYELFKNLKDLVDLLKLLINEQS